MPPVFTHKSKLANLTKKTRHIGISKHCRADEMKRVIKEETDNEDCSKCIHICYETFLYWDINKLKTFGCDDSTLTKAMHPKH